MLLPLMKIKLAAFVVASVLATIALAGDAFARGAAGADARLSGVIRQIVDEDVARGQAAAEAKARAHGLRVRNGMVSLILETTTTVGDAALRAVGANPTGRA